MISREQSKIIRVKCRRDGELYGGRRHCLRWTICTRCCILVVDLLYVASILGWVIGWLWNTSARPTGIRPEKCSPWIIHGDFLLGWPERTGRAPNPPMPHQKEVFSMARVQKSTNLYQTPFCKEYWRDAAAEMKSTKTMVIAAMMIALRVATKGLAVPIAPNLDLFNIASFINALGAMIIGPVVAIPAAFISDFLGVLIWDGLGTYFLPYALQEIGSSLIWALLLYRAKPTPWRVMLGRFSICIFINVILGTSIDMLWQYVYYGQATLALTLPRIVKNTFMFPIESVVMTFFLGLMIPITNRMGLTYSGATAKEAMSFGKKQIALLVVLFVVGVASVSGYLVYNYNTENQASWLSAAEKTELNTALTQEARAQGQISEDQVIIIRRVFKTLGQDEVDVVFDVYDVAEGADQSKMMAYRSTDAKKDEALTAGAEGYAITSNKDLSQVTLEPIE